MNYLEHCNYLSGPSEVEEDDRLIAYTPVIKQVRKLAIEARAKGDKKGYLAYDKVTEILKKAPAEELTVVVQRKVADEKVLCRECWKRYTENCPICAADAGFCTEDYGHCHYGEKEEERG